MLVDFLTDLWTQTGLTPARTILAGFSQGAMMALFTGLRPVLPPLLGNVVSLASVTTDRIAALEEGLVTIGPPRTSVSEHHSGPVAPVLTFARVPERHSTGR